MSLGVNMLLSLDIVSLCMWGMSERLSCKIRDLHLSVGTDTRDAGGKGWAPVWRASLHLLSLLWGLIFAVCTQSPARLEVAARSCVPPADRLLGAVVTQGLSGCSGRALSVLIHTRFSWTWWSCLTEKSSAVNTGWQTPLFPTVVLCGQSALLPNSCLSSSRSFKRDLTVCDCNEGWSRLVGDRQGKNLWREEASLALFPLGIQWCVIFPSLFHEESKSLSAFSCIWKSALFYSSSVVVCLKMGWIGYARELIHFKFLAFSLFIHLLHPQRAQSKRYSDSQDLENHWVPFSILRFQAPLISVVFSLHS